MIRRRSRLQRLPGQRRPAAHLLHATAAPATLSGLGLLPRRFFNAATASPRSARRPASVGTAANTGYTVPTGSKVVIQLVDSISSETSKAGSTFVAILDEPMLCQRHRSRAARRRHSRPHHHGKRRRTESAGKAELGLELTQLYVNGIPYALSTSEYSEAGKSRTGQTVQRAGIGAGIGAVIGAIAGGGKAQQSARVSARAQGRRARCSRRARS